MDNSSNTRLSEQSRQEVHTVCIYFKQQLDTLEAIESWIQILLWEKTIPDKTAETQTSSDEPVVVLRLKGILYPPKDNSDTQSKKKRLVVQGVQELYDIQEGFMHDENDSNDMSSKLVLIGKNLDQQRLLESFKKWVYVDAEC